MNTFKVGDWVKDTATGAYGVVGAAFASGPFISVEWSSGVETKELTDALVPADAAQFYQALRTFAEFTLGLDSAAFEEIAKPAASMTLAALGELEGKLLEMTPADPDAEANYQSTWDTIEQTAQAESPALDQEENIFALFGVSEETEAAAEEPSDKAVSSGKNFIAFQGQIIWGLGPSHDAAFEDGKKSYAEVVRRPPGLGELKVTPCSPELAEVVSRFGGNPGNWHKAEGWKLIDGVGQFIRESATDTTSKGVCAEPDPYHEGEYCVTIDGDIVEQHFSTLEEAQAVIPDWEELAKERAAEAAQAQPEKQQQTPLNKQAMCAKCGNVKVNKSSPTLPTGEKVCKKCELKSKVDAIAMTDDEPVTQQVDVAYIGMDALEPAEITSRFEPIPTNDPMVGQVLERMANEHTEEQIPVPPPSEPIRTDAGLIDPETGELIQESLIMRRFGWSQLPDLSDNPTKEELDAYEAALDQVVDVALSYLERTARYRAAAELRCKDLDGAARFYQSVFIEPMARALAIYRLPRYKSGAKIGEYSKKTMVLNSGAIKFRQTGGFYVHDKEAVRAEIKKQGIDNFAQIDAKEVVSYDHDKLMSALKAGTLKDFPGTGKKPINALASVKLVSPALPQNNEIEGEETDNG